MRLWHSSSTAQACYSLRLPDRPEVDLDSRGESSHQSSTSKANHIASNRQFAFPFLYLRWNQRPWVGLFGKRRTRQRAAALIVALLGGLCLWRSAICRRLDCLFNLRHLPRGGLTCPPLLRSGRSVLLIFAWHLSDHEHTPGPSIQQYSSKYLRARSGNSSKEDLRCTKAALPLSRSTGRRLGLPIFGGDNVWLSLLAFWQESVDRIGKVEVSTSVRGGTCSR